MRNDKKWGILIHLGMNMWGDQRARKKLAFDREVWNRIVDKCAKNGVNTILLDVGEGIRFDSHPEIGIEGSWTPEEMKKEVLRLREMGIALIPKLNFSTVHDAWLGIYERMVSTPVYYQVCRELIHEVYEIFDHPEYIHIGMDEESPHHADDPGYTYVVLRRGDLLYHDVKYFIDCVKETGAKCHMWQGVFLSNRQKAFDTIPKDVVINSALYYSYKKENWTKISEQSQEEQNFYATRFVQRHGYTIEYIEEDPVVTNVIEARKDYIDAGYHMIGVTTNLFIKTNEVDTAEYFKENFPKEQIDGLLTCPWLETTKQNEEQILEAIDFLAQAMDKWYE